VTRALSHAAVLGVLLAAPVAARAQDCSVTSRVVGHGDCSEFASWDAQNIARFVMGAGVSLRTINVGRMTFNGTAEHTDLMQDYAIHGSIFHPATSVIYTADLRAAWYIWRGVYIGGEISLGLGGLPEVGDLTMPNGLVVTPHGLGFFDTGPIVGTSIPLWSVAVLRGEILLGGRSEWIGTTTTSGAESLDGSAASAEWLVEPRGALDFWLSPHVTAGIAAGGDAWPRLNFYGGLFVQVHTRAFDGLHDRWSGS
jgi:hypothetical protein